MAVAAHGKVRRYWPGKAPDWAEGAADEEAGDIGISLDSKRLRRPMVAKNQPEERRADHRRVPPAPAEIVSTVVSEIKTEEDDEALEERRMRIRERRRLLGKDEDELLPKEESSEYETEAEDERMDIAMVKPAVYIPKPQRDTIEERERLKEWERRLEELARKRLDDGRVETRQIVVEEIRKEGQIDKTMLSQEEDGVDTDDELNQAEEYESWKHREMARIKRARGEQPEIERMGERLECEQRKPDPLARPKKKQRRFLQKYYHKGSFFQEGADDMHGHGFSAPTGEDKMNRSILPKVMQVKNFGRRGRTKWTHLVNEDTTCRSAPCVFSSVAC